MTFNSNINNILARVLCEYNNIISYKEYAIKNNIIYFYIT